MGEITEAEAQMVEALFAKDYLSQAERSWLAQFILRRDVDPSSLKLIEARWPEMIRQSKADWLRFGMTVASGAVAAMGAIAILSVCLRGFHG